MIIVFIIYLIFLIWLFEFIDIYGNHSLDRNLNQNITVIIDQINNLNDLFLTMDSIKLQNYNLNNVNLIILDTSTEDVQSLINNYKHIFFGIHTTKVSDINRMDVLHRIESLCSNYILLIESGVSIPKSFISTITKYLDESSLSTIFLPLFYRYKDQYHIFYQLYHCFIESIRCSLINKNFSVSNKNVALKKEAFLDFINGKHENLGSQYLVTPDLCLYKNRDSHLDINSKINIIHIIYSVINFLFIFALLQFLALPNKYFLFIIIIKILPELCFIYTFYNRLQIKFPKFDYAIFSMIGPFYSIIELIYNQILVKNNQS